MTTTYIENATNIKIQKYTEHLTIIEIQSTYNEKTRIIVTNEENQIDIHYEQ